MFYAKTLLNAGFLLSSDCSSAKNGASLEYNAYFGRLINKASTMPKTQPCEVPLHSLLQKYKDGIGYTDCYCIEVPGHVAKAAFVEAFYTSPLFKLERTLLKYLASMPATDADVKRLAAGDAATFSAWRVEAQTASELLLADYTGRTRSWLMAVRVDGSAAPATTLFFGSAVVARANADSRKPSMGWLFHALLGFHRLYSRLLLRAAHARLQQG